MWMYYGFLLLQILINIISSQCKEFEFSDFQARVQKGKDTLDKFNNDAQYKNSECWQVALKMIGSSCRKMSDVHQSFLALQFTNCHLKKSGLQTYLCTIEDFKECTKKMASNIIAFNSYTQFFTHVSDICFYHQSDAWREKTEYTIQKLSKTSEESLEALSKSVEQQKEVLSAQEQTILNQKDILKNENLLRETLLSSAQSMFVEVREHAQQQKTMFSETFDSMFQSVEKLANLQKMLLGEFIGLQSIAFYLVAIIVCYLFTSTPQTSGARLLLFVSLSVLIMLERVFVGWKVTNDNHQNVTSEDIHERIWILRKIFLVVATVILGVFIFRYKDFNRINYAMLQDIQTQLSELRKIQEPQTEKLDSVDGNDTLIPEDIREKEKVLLEAEKKLELSLLQSIVTSTPHKSNIEDILRQEVQNNTKKTSQMKKQYSLAEFSDDDGDLGTTITHKPEIFQNNESTINESKYNLRTRRSTCFGASILNETVKKTREKEIKKGSASENQSKKNNDTKCDQENKKNTGKRRKSTSNKKPAFFSSDDER